MENEEVERMWTVGEVANAFAVTNDTVRNWLRDGTLEGIKIGRGYYWRIPHSNVVKLSRKRHGDGSE